MARLHPRDLAARVAAWPRLWRWAVPVALGAFAGLGHGAWSGGFFPVWVALILALLIVPMPRRASAWFGWLFGLGYFALTLRWLIEPFLVDPLRHGWMAPFALLFMAGGLALFWGAAFWLARWLCGSGRMFSLWLPITLTIAELLRGHILSGFPWGLMSYVWINDLPDVWFAWVGPYGATLLLTGSAGVIAYALQQSSGKVWVVACLSVVSVLIVLPAIARLTAIDLPSLESTVRIIQPNAPQHQKWDPEWMPVFFDRAIAQTAGGAAPDVVIWPETSIPALLDYAQPWMEQMSLAARGAPVVAGIQRRDGGAYYNSAVLIDGPDNVAAISDKAHLVPFGEYIPLAALLRPIGLGTLVDQVAGFSAGTGNGLMQVDGLGLVRVLICYEGIFPEEMQRGGPRPDVLLIITNDAWFGQGAGPRQHLVQAQARAIEQGLPVVRSANTGISAVIDARGNITARLDLNVAGALDALVPAGLPATIYARIGDWPLVVLLTLCIIGGAICRRRFVVDATGAQE